MQKIILWLYREYEVDVVIKTEVISRYITDKGKTRAHTKIQVIELDYVTKNVWYRKHWTKVHIKNYPEISTKSINHIFLLFLGFFRI